MQHIVVDFEFTPIPKTTPEARKRARFEIIEIGAVRLDDDYRFVDSFSTLVKPQLCEIDTHCSVLTGITSKDLENAPVFADAVRSFTDWIGDGNFLLYEWSNNDEVQFRCECRMKGLAAEFKPLMCKCWNDIQRMFTRALGLRNVMGLESALRTFNIRHEGKMHDARDDAYNSAVLLGILRHEDKLAECMKSIDTLIYYHESRRSTIGELFGDLFAEISEAV